MKLAVITPCLYPSQERIHLLLESAYRNNVAIIPYGVGYQFVDWKNMMMEHTIPAMMRRESEGCTHVLYVDGIDSIFISGLDEIVAKYERLGSPPCLMSADSDKPQFNTFGFLGRRPWAYLNAGGFIAEINNFTSTVDYLARKYADDADYQNWFIRAWPLNGFTLDHECSIFQSMNGEPYLRAMGNRLLNPVTGTFPSILHFRGGYCDPETGRESRIKPILKEMNL